MEHLASPHMRHFRSFYELISVAVKTLRLTNLVFFLSFFFQVLVVSMFCQVLSLGNSREKTFQVTVQSFEREYRAKSFLKCEKRPESGNVFRISFTGKKGERGTSKQYLLVSLFSKRP